MRDPVLAGRAEAETGGVLGALKTPLDDVAVAFGFAGRVCQPEAGGSLAAVFGTYIRGRRSAAVDGDSKVPGFRLGVLSAPQRRTCRCEVEPGAVTGRGGTNTSPVAGTGSLGSETSLSSASAMLDVQLELLA